MMRAVAHTPESTARFCRLPPTRTLTYTTTRPPRLGSNRKVSDLDLPNLGVTDISAALVSDGYIIAWREQFTIMRASSLRIG